MKQHHFRKIINSFGCLAAHQIIITFIIITNYYENGENNRNKIIIERVFE